MKNVCVAADVLIDVSLGLGASRLGNLFSTVPDVSVAVSASQLAQLVR